MRQADDVFWVVKTEKNKKIGKMMGRKRFRFGKVVQILQKFSHIIVIIGIYFVYSI